MIHMSTNILVVCWFNSAWDVRILQLHHVQDLYRAKVEELAQRGFRLRSLMKFWEELLEGEAPKNGIAFIHFLGKSLEENAVCP